MADPIALTIARAERLKSDRATWDGHWEAARRLMRPDAAQFQTRATPGQRNRVEVYDNTGETAGDFLAAGLMAMFTNPASKFVGLTTSDDRLNGRERVARWLSDAVDTLHLIFLAPSSGFKLAAPRFYKSLVTPGTAGMFIAERPGQIPFYQTRPLRELLIAEDAQERVDTVYRWTVMTARQAFGQWGPAVGPKTAAKAADPKTSENEVQILHCVQPRRERDPRRIDAVNMRFASLWINVDEKRLIRESGFPEMPYAVARWDKSPDEVYGRGPGLKALPDVAMLNRVQKAIITGAEKLVDPPLQLPDDGVVGGDPDLRSGALNHVREELFFGMRGDPIRAIKTDARPDLGEAFQESTRQRIQDTFLKPLILLSRDARMTATQSIQLEEESLRLMSPIGGELEVEFLGRIVDRTFNIALRQGMFPPVPEELIGRTVVVEFQSPAARAQKLGEARALTQTVEAFAPFIQANPALLDNLRQDDAFRHVAQILGVPLDLITDERRLGEIREARAEADAQAEQAAQIEQMARAAGSAAPALSAVQNAQAEAA